MIGEDAHLEAVYEDQFTVDTAGAREEIADLDEDYPCDEGCPATGLEAEAKPKCHNCCHEYLYEGPCQQDSAGKYCSMEE